MINIAYVCNFASPHARGVISAFAESSELYSVTVFSSAPAAPMDGVRLVQLVHTNGAANVKRGLLGRILYAGVAKLPQVYQHLRISQDLQAVTRLSRNLDAASPRYDIVHGLRTLPEGAIAANLAALTGAKLVLSSWGQDFMLWAEKHRGARRLTGEIMAKLDAFCPDNVRDLTLGKQFGLGKDAKVLVMPAIGGLDFAAMERIREQSPALIHGGKGPVFLSMRGYDNIYVKTSRILDAFPSILARRPDARLILDGPDGHPGLTPMRQRAERLGISSSVSFVHLSRQELFRCMESSDVYVSATTSDGLPVSLLEAMYFGLVPAVSRLESLFPPIEERSNGISFEQMDASSIASACLAALSLTEATSRDLRVSRNRNMLTSLFDRRSNLAKLGDIYSALSANIR